MCWPVKIPQPVISLSLICQNFRVNLLRTIWMFMKGCAKIFVWLLPMHEKCMIPATNTKCKLTPQTIKNVYFHNLKQISSWIYVFFFLYLIWFCCLGNILAENSFDILCNVHANKPFAEKEPFLLKCIQHLSYLWLYN